MKKIFILLIGFLLIISCAGEKKPIKITILYDNYPFVEGLKTDWGFACIIEGTEKTILFDTGTKSDILFHNIEKLNVNIQNVELAVISHMHNDHTGGLLSFLEKNSNVVLYLPILYPDSLVKEIESTKVKIVSLEEPAEICRDVFLTGRMGTMDDLGRREQAIVLNTDKGLVIITGCAHPGIVDMVKKSKEILDKDVYLVFGGFHLNQLPEDEVKKIVSEFRDLGVMNVGPTHCTGNRSIELFKEEYGENFIQMGLGKIVELN